MLVGRANSPRRPQTAEHRAQQTARADRRWLRTSRFGHLSCSMPRACHSGRALARQRGRGSFRAGAPGDSRNAKAPHAVVLPPCVGRPGDRAMQQQPSGFLQVTGEMVSIVLLALAGRFIGFAQATLESGTPLSVDRALSYIANTVGLFAHPNHLALLLAVLSVARSSASPSRMQTDRCFSFSRSTPASTRT